jgi:hypothetical protein
LFGQPVELARDGVAPDLLIEERRVKLLKPDAKLASWSGGSLAMAFSMSSTVMERIYHAWAQASWPGKDRQLDNKTRTPCPQCEIEPKASSLAPEERGLR